MIVNAGSINVSAYFYIVEDSGSANPGEPLTGLIFSDIETGGSASYLRQGAARTDFTLVSLSTAADAHTDGGFIEVDATNLPGIYRCDIPDAAFTAGVDQVILQVIPAPANNATVSPITVELLDTIPTVTNLTNLPTAPTDWLNANALATDAVTEIRDALYPVSNAVFNNIPFVFKTAAGSYVTGATGISATRSIDGAAFAAVDAGTIISEIGNGLYEIDAAAVDMNGGKITFRVSATGGTPGAPADKFITIVTGIGV